MRSRHFFASCARCAEACPVGAITVTEALKVDMEKCTGCGLCTTLCPGGALEATSPTMAGACALAEAQARQTKTVTFACDQHAAIAPEGRSDAITVPCIGRIDETILLVAAAAGAESVRLRHGACEDCERKRGCDVAILAGHQVNLLLGGLGVPSRLELLSQPASGTKPRDTRVKDSGTLSRRAFFAMLGGAAKRATERITAATPPLPEPPNLRPRGQSGSTEEDAPYLPVKWQILSAALDALPGKSCPTSFSGDLWAGITIGESCTGCQMCADSCHTGALAKNEHEGTIGLSFSASRCTGCNVCVDACYLKCLKSTTIVDLRKIVAGETKPLVRRELESVAFLMAPMADKLRRLLGTDCIH
jgi:formate hydrogenlyase subunit 6/NADH:ubiquinone oxidoreductase subunit I